MSDLIVKYIDCNGRRLVDYYSFTNSKEINQMNAELKRLMAAERKSKRELAELRELRKKVSQQKNPDPKVLKMIDDEIRLYQGEPAS